MGLFDWLSGRPSVDTFAESLITRLQAAGDTRSFRYDRAKGQIVYEDGVINLGAMFAEHCQLPKPHRGEHLTAMVRALLPPPPLPDDFADASHDLRVRLWSRMFFSQMGQEHAPPHHLVGSHLVSTIVYDLPNSVQSISQDELDAWGVSYYEAMEVARQQLAQDNFVFASIGDSVHCSATGDTYDASRLLLMDLVQKLPVNGAPIAMVPDRDHLLITGSDDVDGLGMILKIAEDAYGKASRLLCPLPLQLDGDQWDDWMPEPSHPLYTDFRDFELKVLYGAYEEQKPGLEKLHGDERFVASFSAAEKDGKLYSYSTWSKGVPTLLPRTQLVMFCDPDKEAVVASASWERVQGVVGHLIEETDDYPARFFVDGFPTEDELAAIGKVDA